MKKCGIEILVHKGTFGKWYCNGVGYCPIHGVGHTRREAIKDFERRYKAYESAKKNQPVSVARFRPVRGKAG